MLRGIIFDFDGVIAQSVEVKTDAFAKIYMTYGTDIVDRVVEHHESNGGMSRFEKFQLYHELFLKKSISKNKIKDLASQFSKLVVKKVIEAPYVPGALEYIQKCYDKYNLFISTGTPTKEIQEILIGRGIEHYFTDVFGSPDKKNTHINNIEAKYGIRTNEWIFYGDSDTDLDAAKNANIPFVLIQNGFNKKLASTYKGKIINNFIELS